MNPGNLAGEPVKASNSTAWLIRLRCEKKKKQERKNKGLYLVMVEEKVCCGKMKSVGTGRDS